MRRPLLRTWRVQVSDFVGHNPPIQDLAQVVADDIPTYVYNHLYFRASNWTLVHPHSRSPSDRSNILLMPPLYQPPTNTDSPPPLPSARGGWATAA